MDGDSAYLQVKLYEKWVASEVGACRIGEELDSYSFGGNGTLYFMREVDRYTSEPSDYVKIGIVSGDRDVLKREKEHQTGNPRSISTIAEIQSPGVQMLETFMHNVNAKSRVKGEWFRASSGRIENLIDLAAQRAIALEVFEREMNFAANLKNLEIQSGEVILEDTEGLGYEELPLEFFSLGDKLSQLKAQKKLLIALILGRRGEVECPDEVFKKSSRKEALNFSAIAAKKLFPELAQQFVGNVESWSHKFLRPESIPLPVEPSEFSPSGESPIELHDLYLELWGEISRVQWDYQIAEAQLLEYGQGYASLSHRGQTILRWDKKSRATFDKDAFMESYPLQAEQCLVAADAKETYAVAEWKSY